MHLLRFLFLREFRIFLREIRIEPLPHNIKNP